MEALAHNRNYAAMKQCAESPVFPKAWSWFIFAVIAIGSGCLGLISYMGYQIFQSTRPMVVTDFWTFLFLCLMLISISVFLVWKVWTNFSVEISDLGIFRQGFLQKYFMGWEEIKEIRKDGNILFIGEAKRMALNPYVFKEPDKVYRFIQDQLGKTR